MRALILGCGHCGVPASLARLDLGPDAAVAWRPSLCDDVNGLPLGRVEPDLAIVVLAGRDLDRQALFAEELMDAGVHPFRVRFLDAWRLFREPAVIATHVRAALARMRAAEPVDLAPTRATRRFRGHLSRRSVLTLVARHRAPLPRIEPARCRAGSGCDLCVRACPTGAIARGVPPHIDPAACTSCGVCLPACPTGAVAHPSLSVEGLEAEAHELSDAPHLNLLVVCTAALLDPEATRLDLDPSRWRLLEAPAMGALRSTDVLRLRAKGFDRIVGLSVGGCCPGTPGPFAVASALLGELGFPGRVEHWDLEEGPFPSEWSRPLPEEAPPLPSVDSLHGLAAALGGADVGPVALPGRGAGLVALDTARCTMCGLCAERCWSKALALEEPEPGNVLLTFDHAACDGCGMCADVCPERALSVRHAVDAEALGERTVLKEDSWVLCTSCGNRVAPRSMIVRVAARMKAPVDLDLCPDCKPLRIVGQIGPFP